MSDQDEALRLAAALLRRQREEIEALEAERDALRADVERLTTQNAALLQTLRRAEEVVELCGLNAGFIRVAIDAAKEAK